MSESGPDGANELGLVSVTPSMVDAGISELAGHGFLSDPRYLVESVYRAMHYERLADSSGKHEDEDFDASVIAVQGVLLDLLNGAGL